MARTFGQRPSSLLDLDDPHVAYAVDEALFLRLKAAERTGGDGNGHGRGYGPPSPDDLIGLPVIGDDGVSRYLN